MTEPVIVAGYRGLYKEVGCLRPNSSSARETEERRAAAVASTRRSSAIAASSRPTPTTRSASAASAQRRTAFACAGSTSRCEDARAPFEAPPRERLVQDASGLGARGVLPLHARSVARVRLRESVDR